MKSRLLACIAWMVTAFSLSAASMKLPFVTIGSITYSNVTVLGYNASDLFFTSDHGIRNVKLRLLAPDLQQKFNYDPAEAQKAEEQQAEDEQRYHDNLAAQLTAEYNSARDAREAEAQAIYAAAGLADPAPGGNSPIGKPAPDLDFEKWVGTRPDMNGKFVIVSVWSPKSVSWRKWIPSLNDLYKNFQDKVNFVGVTSATETDVVHADPKPDFPCAIDTDNKFMSAANVTTFPCVMLVDTNHVVRYEGHPAALTSQALQSVLTKPEEPAP